MCWIRKIAVQSSAKLALGLLAGVASGVLVAQQPDAINRDSQVRVQPQDRSVNAVDPDPEKAKQDAITQGRVPQQYSNWGPQRNQAQKAPVNGGAPTAQPASIWEHNNIPAVATVLIEAEHEKPIRDPRKGAGVTRYGLAAKAKSQPGQPPTRISGTVDATQPAAEYLGSRNPAGPLNFSSSLRFDPMRRLSSKRAGLKPRSKKPPSRAYADSYCRTSTLSMETKQLCAQWKNKGNRSIH